MSTLASATNLSFPISQKSPSSMFWGYRAFVMNWHFPLEKGLLRLLWNPVSLYRAAKNLAIDVRRFKFHFIPTADYQKCSCCSNQGKLFQRLSGPCCLRGLRFQHSALEGLLGAVRQLIRPGTWNSVRTPRSWQSFVATRSFANLRSCE